MFESFVFYWLVRDHLALARPVVQALIFLKLHVSGHRTIYLTRNTGPVRERLWPSWKLVVPCETTQVVSTLVVVYGFFMAATGWPLALMTWAYTLVSFFVASAVKIGVYRMIAYRFGRQGRHLGDGVNIAARLQNEGPLPAHLRPQAFHLNHETRGSGVLEISGRSSPSSTPGSGGRRSCRARALHRAPAFPLR